MSHVDWDTSQYRRLDRETLVNYELDIERIVIEDMEDDLTIIHTGTHLTLNSRILSMNKAFRHIINLLFHQ